MRVHAVHELIEHRINNATKPFNARGAKVQRCLRCRVATKYCLCQFQPAPFQGFAAILLYSNNEVLKPSNTGRLIADICEDSYAFEWQRTEMPDQLKRLLNDPAYQPILVFPCDYLLESNTVIEPSSVKGMVKIPLFIFLDASWREARRIYRKSAYLHHLPCLSISEKSLSDYIMRKAVNEQQLATCEVASLVLNHAGFTDAADTLQQWFEVIKESYMLTKTQGDKDFTRPKLSAFLNSSNAKDN
ncbi:tRNA-uridine aminocarboxypropyltransferase [Vibrio gallicus]|uniref:tRNA-uridine aminocarboxypropyltransferase n=1 Tax=Vibrio gallicus TaxID=190897 RepID=UPI0021C3090D|nr:DTW domain-containing protein [Vibrio gallicus]